MKMKDSGVEWIGEIPEGWKILRAKNIFRQRNTKGNTVEIHLAATQDNGMYPQHLLDGVVKVKEETNLQEFRTVHKNDFVISLRSFQGGFEKSDYEGVCSPAYQVFYNTSEIDHNYFKKLFKSDGFIAKMNSLTVGIREGKNIQYCDFANSLIPLPPKKTQQKIATYLDEKCSQIEKTIQNQQQVIEKLKAYKQSLITEAVTGKVKIQNGKVAGKYEQYKDSGVDYLAEIPASWTMKRLRYIGSCQNGISKGGEYFGSGYPFVSYGDVYKNIVLPETVNGLIESTEEERENYSVRTGDIFFTRTSETIEEVGFTSVCLKTIENATFAGFVIRVRPNTDDLIPDFSKYYFKSEAHRRFFVKEMNLVTRASLSQDLLKRLPVLIPPKEEQKSIASYLDKTCTSIDSAIEKKQKLIEKLTEYKKSLIYECVTGKKEI